MPYSPFADKEETCESCGKVFIRAGGRRMHQCHDCRIAKVMAIAAQGHLKQGVYWEKVVRGQLRKWHREAELVGITDECQRA